MTVFEVVKFQFQKSSAADLASTSYYEDLQLLGQQPGLHFIWEGQTLEDPTKAFWIVEWEKIEDHQRFIDDKALYKPFLDRCLGLCDPQSSSPIELFHYPFLPHELSSLVSSSTHPFIEVLQCKVKVDKSVTDWKKAIAEFLSEAKALGVLGISETAVEDDRVVTMMMGWKSLEEHESAKKNRSFGAAIMPCIPLWSDVKMGHVQFKEVQRKSKAKL